MYGPNGPAPAEIELIPAGRLGTPSEIAAVACFLGQEDSDDPVPVRGTLESGAEAAAGYGITDNGGRVPPSHRGMLGAPREPSAVIVR